MSDELELSLDNDGVVAVDEKPKVKIVKEEPPQAPQEEDQQTITFSSSEKEQILSLQSDFSDFLNETVGGGEEDVNSIGMIETVSTGIDILDAILGGGIGIGTLTLIIGNPGTFKSTLLGNILSNAQKQFRGKMLGAYLDSENATTTERLYDLGVRYPKIKPRTEVTAEGVFKIIEAMCSYKESKKQEIIKKNNDIKKDKTNKKDEGIQEVLDFPGVIGWDSVANTITEKELEDPSLRPEQVTGLRARILSSFLPRYISKMRDYRISLIAINQLRDKIDIGMSKKANDLRWMGDKTMPGGNSLKFNAFHLIALKAVADLDPTKYGFNGLKIKASCIKNKLFTPNIPVDLIINFNTGISNFFTNYEFLVECNRLQPKGWASLRTFPEVKWQGAYKAMALYNEDEKGFRKAWDEAVKEAIRTEIIDKYKSQNVIDGEGF